MPNGSDIGRANLSKIDAAGIGGTAETVSVEALGNGRSDIVRSAAGPLQMCSPIIEISIWRLHDEHLTVGMNVDSRGTAMLV